MRAEKESISFSRRYEVKKGRRERQKRMLLQRGIESVYGNSGCERCCDSCFEREEDRSCGVFA